MCSGLRLNTSVSPRANVFRTMTPVKDLLETILVPNIDFLSLNFNDRIHEIKQQVVEGTY